MDYEFEKYLCDNELYLIYDPNRNTKALDEECLHVLRNKNAGAEVVGIMTGPFIENNVYSLKAYNVNGTKTGLTHRSLRAFHQYLVDQAYVKEEEPKTRVYAGENDMLCFVEKTGKVFLSI